MPGGWSISNEILFYLTLPLFFIWVRNVRHALWPAFELTVLEIGDTLLSLHYYDYPVNLHMYYFYWFPNQFPIFARGILLFFMVQCQPVKLNAAWARIFILITVLWIVTLTSMEFHQSMIFFIHYVYSILFVVFAYLLSISQPAVLVNRLTVFIGNISFSMYLIHFFIVELTIILIEKTGLHAPDSLFQYLFHLLVVIMLTVIAAR
ncbi:acyltransferase [Macrococcus hajekii]|uniref:Acyltransferase n=1 Tax=Macrococcus hajekii TaxID=198482 RepID=A0A4R6BND3_9STAP|nr:acyltransferase family protein [Macrococcus hajekii]TDM03356.1 acyltransferase [Macrococcus hajekii]